MHPGPGHCMYCISNCQSLLINYLSWSVLTGLTLLKTVNMNANRRATIFHIHTVNFGKGQFLPPFTDLNIRLTTLVRTDFDCHKDMDELVISSLSHAFYYSSYSNLTHVPILPLAPSATPPILDITIHT